MKTMPKAKLIDVNKAALPTRPGRVPWKIEFRKAATGDPPPPHLQTTSRRSVAARSRGTISRHQREKSNK